MRITIFGSTGPTGRLLVDRALRAGHDVAAVARHPGAIDGRPHLSVIPGTPVDEAVLVQALAGCDAVLCALGGRPWRRRERVCSTAMQHIVPAMAAHGVRRIVAISTFGAGDTRPQVGGLARALLFGLLLRSEVADKEAMEAQLAASDLDWTVVRVGVLTDAPPLGAWRAADDGSIRGMGRIARGDVAAFMIRALDENTWVRRRPVLVQQARGPR